MNEQISALMDGELGDAEASATIGRLGGDESLRDAWNTYHLIGDVLREGSVAAPAVVGRVSERLSTEATVLAPRRRRSARQTWQYALAAAAGVAAVAVVGWVSLPQQFQAVPVAMQQPARLDAGQPVQVVATPVSGALNEYLLAHQAYAPSTQMRGVAPFVRTVADSPQDAAR